MENDIAVTELSEAEFQTVGGSRGRWDSPGILDFAKELSQEYPNKVVGMPLESISRDGKKIDGFYSQFYKGPRKIKYIGYYCRKRLIEAFETLKIEADVRISKNQLLIQFRSSEVAEEVEAETDEED